MASKLTEQAVKNLAVPKKAPRTIWDARTTGLGIRVTPKGTKTWIMQLRFPGQLTQSRRTLGYFPALGVGDAREKAERWYSLARSGLDPSAVEEEERRKAEAEKLAEAEEEESTFAAVAESYIKDRKNRRADKDAREIRRLLIPEFGTRPINTIMAQDVKKLIDRLKERVPYDARNCWGHAVGVFKFAVHEGKLAASPCASLDRDLLFRHAKIAPRQRLLNDDEVFALWRAAGRLGYPVGPFMRLLLLTGTRIGELMKARFSELHPELRQLIRKAQAEKHAIDWSTVPAKVKLWTVPAARFKSGIDHVVPLSDDACAIIAALPRIGKSDFMFTLTGKKAVWIGSKAKQQLDRRMVKTLRALARRRGDDPASVELERWTFHDTRRVVRTALSALKIEAHICEMCVGHTRGGTLEKIYDLHRYADEIREAMDKWADRLRSIVAPSPAPAPTSANVISIGRKR